MKNFNVGNVIIDGKSRNPARVITSKNDKLKTYRIGFTSGSDFTFEWSFEHAHMNFKLKVPNYIPKEQHEMYRKLKNGRY